MRCLKMLLSAVALAAVTVAGQAQPLKIGAPAPKFTDLECTDGKTISFDDLKDKDILVIAITTNHCPVAQGYEDRLIDFYKKYCSAGSKVGMVAINVNNGPPDRLDKMKEHAKEKGFNFPYAYDPSQKIAVDLGASVTPEFFVFDKQRKLVYHGAFDDNWKEAESVTKHYLVPAIEAMLKGQTITTPETTPHGCGILYRK